MNIESLLTRLSGVRKAGGGFVARCPSHEDKQQSLSLSEGDQGRILVKCHAGCSPEQVVGALKLTMGDLFREKQATRQVGRGELVATYPYRDELGQLLFEVLRFKNPKTFRQRRPDGKGGHLWNTEGVRRVPYQLDALSHIPRDEAIYIVEGEKDVENLRQAGAIATTNAGGAGKWGQLDPASLRVFSGRPVVILPDNDAPGQKHGAEVARSLSGIAASLKVLSLPELPPKGDVSDWLAAGGDSKKLAELAAACPQWSEEAQLESDEEPWADLIDIPGELRPVPLLDEKLLPEAFRPWLADVAERMQCPLEYPATAAIVALSALIGRQCAVRPKRNDSWTVIPNLWGAIIGGPGVLKSPSLSEGLHHLERLQAKSYEEYEQALEAHELEQIRQKSERELREKRIRELVKKGKSKAEIRELIAMQQSEIDDEDEPKLRRYITNDCTVEKLGEILRDNPRGVLQSRDELTGWLRQLDRDGHEADRAFYLEAWTGLKSFTYDRIGRGTMRIEAACVSVIGSIQPGPLAEYLRQAVRGGAGDDGFIQRFQLLVYPDPPKTWRNVDRQPNAPARNRAYLVYKHLDGLAAAGCTFCSDREDDDDAIPFLRFSPEAQRFFDDWHQKLRNHLLDDEDHPALRAHLAKYPKLMPSLALLFHLAEGVGDEGGVGGPITLGAAELAAGWCEFLEGHARRIYQCVSERDMQAARLLIAKVRSGKVKSPFVMRDVYRPQWTGLTTPDDAQRALEVLEAFGWVRKRLMPTGPAGGRPTFMFQVNPALGPGRLQA